jgi:hypothetical protein
MKKIFFLILILSQIAFAQNSSAKYEAEMVKNPNKGGKDTRQVNAVIIFEKDSIKIVSRRKNEVFKEFKYTDIKRVEHSFSKTPLFPKSRTLAILTVFARKFRSRGKALVDDCYRNGFCRAENRERQLSSAEK